MQLRDDQTVVARLTFMDKKGRPAKVDGAPVWSVDRADILVLTPAADGMSCTITTPDTLPADPTLTAVVTAEADADLGEGVRSLTITGDVEVVGGEAGTAVMSFDTPTS